ncbi:MAG: pilus assembly protein [Planctomycetaceae bacterium]|nr:pilus assembly protein [Planctomycetaceae bacterium]MCP4941431.1 pilus assembly protein [Planctomycetaceae bacterium]
MMRNFVVRRCFLCRRGTSAVEFAVIAPLMILFTFGLVEVGRLMLVKQTLTHAAREGARVAVRPNADITDVRQRILDELLTLEIEDPVIETEPGSLESAEPGAAVTVRVRVGINSVSWIPGYLNFAVDEIVAETCMLREYTQ